jgi:hypothetical protein
MIPIESTIHHNLGQRVAVERIHQMAATLSQRFPQQVHQIEWRQSEHSVDMRFAAYGFVVSWAAEVDDTTIYLHGQIPDAARPYRKKIEQAVTARVEATVSDLPQTFGNDRATA